MTDNQNTRLLALTQGKYAIVDAEDYDWLNQWKWQQRGSYKYPAIRFCLKNRKEKIVYMHDIIMKTPSNTEVDHINGDTLNNTKANLRLATHQQNMMNQKIRLNGSSKYKGVWFFKKQNSWQSYININGKKTHLGSYKTEVEAAKSYNNAAKEHFGEFARLNQIGD